MLGQETPREAVLALRELGVLALKMHRSKWFPYSAVVEEERAQGAWSLEDNFWSRAWAWRLHRVCGRRGRKGMTWNKQLLCLQPHLRGEGKKLEIDSYSFNYQIGRPVLCTLSCYLGEDCFSPALPTGSSSALLAVKLHWWHWV